MEAMAVETILAALWELDGYLTKTRVAYKMKNAYSDIDVIGLKKNDMRIGECKARFGPREVMIITQKDAKDFLGWLGDWGGFALNLKDLWRDKYDWMPELEELENMELWFCSNIYFEDGAYEIATNSFERSIQNKLPKGLKTESMKVEIISTLDVYLKTYQSIAIWVDEYGWGKRFGNPILDSLREMYRYLNCNETHFGGKAVHCKEIQRTSLEKIKSFYENPANKRNCD